MLGTIGFSVAIAAFLAYGISSYILARKAPAFNKLDFLTAYILIAGACLLWVIGIHVNIVELQNIVLFGDALLLLACAFLAVTTCRHSWRVAVLLAGALATILLIIVRVESSSMDAIVSDGILIFHTPRLFGAMLALIFLFVWMKANMHFFSEVFDKKLQQVVRPAYFSANLLAFIAVVAFLFSHKTFTITVSFIMLVGAFVSLVMLNLYAKQLVTKAPKHAK